MMDEKGCDGKPQRISITELEKEIVSPYQPLKYPNKADCSYIVELPPENVAKITFLRFDFQEFDEQKASWLVTIFDLNKLF